MGTVSRSLPVDLERIVPTDRARLWNILRGSAKSGPVFISLFPEDDDPELEQAHQLYGKLASDLAISHPMPETSARRSKWRKSKCPACSMPVSRTTSKNSTPGDRRKYDERHCCREF